MNQGWVRKKLKDCFKLKSGDGLTAKNMIPGDYPVFGGNSQTGTHNTFNLSGDNIIVGRVGALCGNARHITENIWLTDNAFKIMDKKYEFDNNFLTYLLNYNNLRSFARQAAQPVISNSSLKDLELDFPTDVEEQKRITAILDQAFADLEQTRAKTEQNLKNARELFDSYLQQVCVGNEKNWVKCQVGDVCDLWQGLAINKKTKHLLVDKSSLPLLRIKDLKYNSSEQYVAEEGFPAKALVNEDEVIYTRTGQVGLVFRGFKGILHNNSFKVSPNDKIKKSYLFWWLQHTSFKSEIMKLASKAAQPDISHTSFKKQPISIPPVSYQLSSVIQIEKMSKLSLEVEAIYKKKLSALNELKKSILQKAFSGELTAKAE